MKMEIKKLTEELNDEREQNNLLSDKVVEMEMSLSRNKVKLTSVVCMAECLQPRSGYISTILDLGLIVLCTCQYGRISLSLFLCYLCCSPFASLMFILYNFG